MPDLIQFRPGPLLPKLEQRARNSSSPDLVAKRDLDRYYETLRRELARLSLSRGEACLICDAANGLALLDAYSPFYLPAEVADAISLNQLDQKWDVDGEVLMGKLARMTPTQILALCDATEQFWARYEDDTDVVLREIGLVRDA